MKSEPHHGGELFVTTRMELLVHRRSKMEKAIRSFLITSLYTLGISSADIIVLLGITRDIFDYNLQKVGGAKAFGGRPKYPFKAAFERYIQIELSEELDEKQKQLYQILTKWLKLDMAFEFIRGLLFAQHQSTLVVLGEKDSQYIRLLERLGIWQFTTKDRKYQSAAFANIPYERDIWIKFLVACVSGECRMPSSQESLRDRLTLFVDASFDRSEVVLPVADGRIAEAVEFALSTLNQWQRMLVENKFLGGKHELDLSEERARQLEMQIMRKLHHPVVKLGIMKNVITLGGLETALAEQTEKEKEVVVAEKIDLTIEKYDSLHRPLCKFDLSVRSTNCMEEANILYVGDLAASDKSTLLKIRNFGRRGLKELDEILNDLGLTIGCLDPVIWQKIRPQ